MPCNKNVLTILNPASYSNLSRSTAPYATTSKPEQIKQHVEELSASSELILVAVSDRAVPEVLAKK